MNMITVDTMPESDVIDDQINSVVRSLSRLLPIARPSGGTHIIRYPRPYEDPSKYLSRAEFEQRDQDGKEYLLTMLLKVLDSASTKVAQSARGIL